MEGEELGQDRTIITGRKGLVPFDINFGPATKANNVNSYQFTYVRADYILYVRPDLVVTVLGKWLGLISVKLYNKILKSNKLIYVIIIKRLKWFKFWYHGYLKKKNVIICLINK